MAPGGRVEAATGHFPKVLRLQIRDMKGRPQGVPGGGALNTVAVADKGLALTISGKNLSLEKF